MIHTIFIEWDEEDSEWIIEGESVEKIIIARTSSGVPISWSDRTVDYAPGIWSALATAMSRSQEYQLRLDHWQADLPRSADEKRAHLTT